MAKKKANKEIKNYLDFVPVVNPKNTWDETDGKVTINMVHRGFYASIAQKVFHKPRVSHIDLDEYGSFIWLQIDGQRTIGQIAEILHERFGKKSEPLYDRLVKYMQILRNNQFILLKGKDKLAQ